MFRPAVLSGCLQGLKKDLNGLRLFYLNVRGYGRYALSPVCPGRYALLSWTICPIFMDDMPYCHGRYALFSWTICPILMDDMPYSHGRSVLFSWMICPFPINCRESHIAHISRVKAYIIGTLSNIRVCVIIPLNFSMFNLLCSTSV